MCDNIFSLDVIDHVQIMSTLKERQNLVKYCVRRACDLRLLNTTALFQSIIIQKEGDSVVTVSCRPASGWKGGGEQDQSRLWDERRLSHFHKEDRSNTCFDLPCQSMNFNEGINGDISPISQFLRIGLCYIKSCLEISG